MIIANDKLYTLTRRLLYGERWSVSTFRYRLAARIIA